MEEFVVQGGTLLAFSGPGPNVDVPEGVVSIGANAFRGNLLIRRTRFPSSLRVVGKGAFQSCANLEVAEGMSCVVDFREECFEGAGLVEATIGRGVERIGKLAFANMPNLVRVNYYTERDCRLSYAFARCPKLEDLDMRRNAFFPFFCAFQSVRGNPDNRRPTFFDAFVGTPLFRKLREEVLAMYKRGICPDCGGKIKKGLLSAKCASCGIKIKTVSYTAPPRF